MARRRGSSSPGAQGEGLAPPRRARGAPPSGGKGASHDATRPDRPSRPLASLNDLAQQAGRVDAGLVRLGEFGRVHGLKGEVRLKSYTADPVAIATYGPLAGEDGRTYALTSIRPASGAAPDVLVARVEGVLTRDAAEALNRVGLFVDRARLSRPEDEDEFLAADLVGLSVEDLTGLRLGTVFGVVDYGGGDLLQIKAEAIEPVLLPFTKRFVPVVDIVGRKVVADPPLGFFDGDAEVSSDPESGEVGP